MTLFKRIVPLVFLLFCSALSVAQSTFESITITDWPQRIETSKESSKQILINELNENQENPIAWLVLGELYKTEALSKNPFENIESLHISLDSSDMCLRFVQQYTSKKDLRKGLDFYTYFLSGNQITLDNIEEKIFAKIEENAQRRVLSQEIANIFNEATAYYTLSQKRYSVATKEHSSNEAIKLLNESAFAEKFIPIAYNYLQSKTLISKAYQLSDSVFSNIPNIVQANEPTKPLYQSGILSMYNFQEWYESLSNQRREQVLPLQQKSINKLRTLLSLENSIIIDSTNANIATQIPEINSLKEEWKQLETNNVFLEYLSFKRDKIKLMRQVIEEKSYFDYNHGQEEIFEYFYGFQEQTRHLSEKLNYINTQLEKGAWQYHAPVLEKFHASEQDFKASLNKEKAYLNTRYNYFELRIRDQLLYENIELKYLPRYSEYKDGVIPLFEQSMNMVVEEGDYVTTRILKDEVGNLYITGYRKVKGKKGFVARVVGERISWINWAQKPEYINQKEFDSYGVLLSPNKNGGCLAVMQYKIKGDDSSKNYTPHLVALDSSGVVNQSITLQTTLNLEDILSTNDETESFLTASLGDVAIEEVVNNEKSKKKKKNFSTYNGVPIPETSQPELTGNDTANAQDLPKTEALVVSKIDYLGEQEWSTSFAFRGNLSGMLEMDDKYILVCNQQLKEDSNEHKILLVALDKKGKIIAQKSIETDNSCFATRTLKLDGERVLVVGFEGDYELNNLENKGVINMLINEDLELLESNVK